MVKTAEEILAIADEEARKIFDIPAKKTDIGLSTPENDAGQWSPKSLLIVYCEMGYILDPWIHELNEEWHRWEAAISKRIGYDVFFESINAAVSALYEA